MTYLVLTSMFILCTYVVLMIKKHGIPETLSYTYYHLGFKYPLFTYVIWAVGGLILPACMDRAADSDTQLVPFLGIFGVLLVGAAPRVKDYERKTHIIGALMAGIGSQLWVALYGIRELGLMWFIPLIVLGIELIKTRDRKLLIENLDKKGFIFWCELGCFLTIYLSLLCQ